MSCGIPTCPFSRFQEFQMIANENAIAQMTKAGVLQ